MFSWLNRVHIIVRNQTFTLWTMRVKPQLVLEGERFVVESLNIHTDTHASDFHFPQLWISIYFPFIFISCSRIGKLYEGKKNCEKKANGEKRKIFEHKEVEQEDKNRRKCLPRHIDVKMNCLFIDNTLDGRKKENGKENFHGKQ